MLKRNIKMVKIVLKVEGMACGMCEAHVNDAVRNAVKVKKVKSSRKKGITEISAAEDIDLAAVKQAIESAGYKVIE